MAIGRKRRRRGVGKVPGLAIGIGLIVGLIAIVWAIGFGRDRGPTRRVPLASGAGDLVVRVRLVARAESVGLIVDGLPRTVRAGDLREPLAFESTPARPVGVNGKRYHGTIRVVPADGGTLDVINACGIDDYLRGVVPRESLAYWPIEALKAQAVASRTYALFQVRSRAATAPAGDDRGFDLRADTGSQMYGGIEAEVASTNQAVEATRGIVLASGPAGRERIFSAYFSSTCGGATASGADLFDDATPALAAHEGDGCTDSPRYRWPDFSVRKDELARRFRLWGTRQSSPIAEIGRLRAVEIAKVNEFGRPVRFAATDEGGRRYELSAEHFRNACNAGRPDGQPEFYSSYFVPLDAGDSVRITDGRGWGHGVGLCQYCAAGWAKRGWSFAKILDAGYPGATLVRAY